MCAIRTRIQEWRQADPPEHIAPRFALLVALVLYTLVSSAQTARPEATYNVFDVASDFEFQDYKRIVTEYVYKNKPASASDICIVGYIEHGNVKTAWVIWHQRRKIILWEGQNDLDWSRRILDLKKDVVPTENDLHGSTYLVTKAWVKQLTTDCAHSGVKLHIPKPTSHGQH